MKYLYPKIPAGRLWAMLRIAMVGAVVAGIYGALHDQISYSISPEYFTKLKFRQFSYADFGWPPRLFASEIGFLATWWVGLLGGWFLARAGLVEVSKSHGRQSIVKAFATVLAGAVVSGLFGALLGFVVTNTTDLSQWRDLKLSLDIHDVRGFIIVDYIHAGGYLGALAGLILAILYVRRMKRRLESAG